MLFRKNKGNEYESNYRKTGDNTLVIIVSFIAVIAIIGISIYKNNINNKCSNFEKNAIDAGFKFAMSINQLPSYEGEPFKLKLNSIPGWDNNFRGSSCGGTLNIIKTSSGYVKELDLTDCNKCTTSKKSLSKATEKYKENKNIVKVSVTYNYQNREISYSPWTDWYESSLISPNVNANNVNLPYDEKNYPKVPDNSEIISYDVEKKIFYSYRDKSWKFYKNANNNYSTFSSTKPADYAYKDGKTEITSDYSEWSTNYPEEYDYRKISTATGYRFYYTDDNKNNIYYNDGNYTVKIEDETLAKLYNKKEKDSVKMYRYVDSMWKWYNGSERNYSSYTNIATNNYPYKDDDIYKFSSWSSYKETSSIDDNNSSYREEKTDTHSRYRAKYAINSLDVFNEYLPREEFEIATNRTMKDMQDDEKVKVIVKYTYQYGK